METLQVSPKRKRWLFIHLEQPHRLVANDHENEFGATVAEFLHKDFYVGDGLKSVLSIDEAVNLVANGNQMCNRGSFWLHKFVSNSKEVMRRIPESDRADGVKEQD